MFDFISVDFVELWGTGRERKLKMKIYVSNRMWINNPDSNLLWFDVLMKNSEYSYK